MALGITNNLSAMIAQNNLQRSNMLQRSSLQKLSSGLRVNQAKDGPADLVISEYLRGQLSGLERAARNSQEAHNTLSIAEGGLGQMSGMLQGMRGLAIHALNRGVTSSGQVNADQSELNSLVNTIRQVAGTTRYGGQPLLNGSRAISFAANDPAGLLDTGETRIDLVADDIGAVNVSFAGGAANQAEKAHVESAAMAGGTLTQETSFTVRGDAGAQEFTFAAGTALGDIADTINNATDRTGVTAYAINGGTELRLVSGEYGAEASVEVEQGAGDALFAAKGTTVRDEGQNATLTVKGITLETDGLAVDVKNSAFSGRLAFREGDPANTTIAQTGYDQDALTNAAAGQTLELGNIRGGMQLQLGEGAGAQERQVFGIGSMDPSNLGRVTVGGESYSLADIVSGGKASLANNPGVALQVIDQAIADVSGERARIGAYQSNTLQTNINSLNVALENVTSTESSIRDTNMAAEVTNFVRAQILSQTGLMGIQSSNVNAQNTLRLLGAGN